MLTAEVILMHTGNKHSCHIQLPSDNDVDVLGRFIDVPMLWDTNAWHTSVEKYNKEKIRAQNRREAQFVYEGNVKLIARNILKMAFVHPDAATMIARSMLDKKDLVRMKAVGVKRLYEKVNELPDK